MKNTFTITVVLFLLAITACNTAPKTETSTIVTDSLMMQWNNAWNASDADQIAALFADNAVLVTGGVISGKDSIRAKFIQNSVVGLRNLKTEKIYETISADFVTQTGSYSHDWVKKDSTIEKSSGYYTFIWQKQADTKWQIVLVQM